MSEIVTAMKEAEQIAKGEIPAARLHHKGHVYVPLAEVERLRAALREADQWRPISETPPEFKRILATDGDVRGEAWRHGNRYYWVDDSAAGGITHWMPLPPPPKQEMK